jgi:hypothetical protein
VALPQKRPEAGILNSGNLSGKLSGVNVAIAGRFLLTA